MLLVEVVHSFALLCNILLYVYTTIYPFYCCRKLEMFTFLAIMKSTTMNILVYTIMVYKDTPFWQLLYYTLITHLKNFLVPETLVASSVLVCSGGMLHRKNGFN